MSAKVEASVPRQSRLKETIVDFEPVRVKAPFFLRCGALLADYIVFILVPVIGLILGRYLGNDGARLLGGSLSEASWLIAILLAFTNFIVLPIFSGQSIGKMVAGLRIVGIDGRTPGKGAMLLRQTVGYLLTAGSLGLGFLFSVFSSKGRALHDYLAGTVVIYADRRIR